MPSAIIIIICVTFYTCAYVRQVFIDPGVPAWNVLVTAVRADGNFLFFALAFVENAVPKTWRIKMHYIRCSLDSGC